MAKTVVKTQEPTTPQLIEMIQRRAEAAPEPQDPQAGRWFHQADGEVPVDIVIDHLSSAGYTYIYDIRTGDRSVTNNNMLQAQLQKKRQDGMFVFSLEKPNVTPHVGHLRCLLHPEDPRRAEYDALGLPACDREGIKSPYQVTQHMRHRHPAEWAAIEERRLQQEKENDRTFQREMLEAMAKK